MTLKDMQIMTAAQLAAYCRQLREAAGLTPSELARRLSVDRRRIEMAENERRPYELAIRQRIIAELAGLAVEKRIVYELRAPEPGADHSQPEFHP